MSVTLELPKCPIPKVFNTSIQHSQKEQAHKQTNRQTDKPNAINLTNHLPISCFTATSTTLPKKRGAAITDALDPISARKPTVRSPISYTTQENVHSRF